ncbi:uncharacterized protein [Primulina eburnea]|uniref:uncharacterized protein n=1 Tax=Primulina eburnea TaxID=1245227 RepID=UPI003C6CB8B8
MSGAAQEFQFSLRVVLNQQETKVLYAAVSRDFVDVLLSFFTLPLGTIVRLLVRQHENEAPSLGSLTSLYKGLKDLDVTNFSWDVDRWLLLRPLNYFEVQCRKLRLRIDDTNHDICRNFESERCTKDVMYYAKLIRCCGGSVNVVETPSGGGVFVTSPQSFIITDDLKVFPDLPEDGLRILRDACGVESMMRERTVSFGYLEVKPPFFPF